MSVACSGLTLPSTSLLQVHQHTTSCFIQTLPWRQSGCLASEDQLKSGDVFRPRSVSFSQEGDFHTPTTDDQTLPETTYNCYTLDKPYLAIG
jgi:hypothetical protein